MGNIDTQTFPPTSCTAWEDCNHDGVCHDRQQCKAIGPNEPSDNGDEDACVVCGEHLEDGDLVYWSTNDDGHMHAECATSYVDDDGKETDAPPKPMKFRANPSPQPKNLSEGR
ncbi:hypothetical protein [Rhizobium rhizoryzae]|uniref:Uncharacterized protein n=1 Tax=Rhizobium rhizoryzae TaxID=451876 RepID=A0A7W6LNB2_9HYPH|nr:hypothetical protein [Rhizobium rhizoryzae]MBB4146246.1 hypothetical protein [Rhizobium rhizoryzae]